MFVLNVSKVLFALFFKNIFIIIRTNKKNNNKKILIVWVLPQLNVLVKFLHMPEKQVIMVIFAQVVILSVIRRKSVIFPFLKINNVLNRYVLINNLWMKSLVLQVAHKPRYLFKGILIIIVKKEYVLAIVTFALLNNTTIVCNATRIVFF